MDSSLSLFSGTQFLLLYGVSIVAAWVAASALVRWLRPEGDASGQPSMEELAVLTGGRTRLADATIASLLGRNAIQVDGTKGFSVAQPDAGRTSAERAILRSGATISLADADKALALDADAIGEALERKGLVTGSAAAWQLRLIALIPFVLVLLLGLYRKAAGDALGEPTGILLFLMVLAGIVAVVRMASVSRLTQAGQAVLDDARAASSRLKRAPTEPEMGTAVALYGTGVLAGTGFASFHSMRQSSGDSGGGADSGSSDSGGDGGGDGGSGCGGGGCGGCGG